MSDTSTLYEPPALYKPLSEQSKSLLKSRDIKRKTWLIRLPASLDPSTITTLPTHGKFKTNIGDSYAVCSSEEGMSKHTGLRLLAGQDKEYGLFDIDFVKSVQIVKQLELPILKVENKSIPMVLQPRKMKQRFLGFGIIQGGVSSNQHEEDLKEDEEFYGMDGAEEEEPTATKGLDPMTIEAIAPPSKKIKKSHDQVGQGPGGRVFDRTVASKTVDEEITTPKTPKSSGSLKMDETPAERKARKAAKRARKLASAGR